MRIATIVSHKCAAKDCNQPVTVMRVYSSAYHKHFCNAYGPRSVALQLEELYKKRATIDASIVALQKEKT